jgi:hypothetical protein
MKAISKEERPDPGLPGEPARMTDFYRQRAMECRDIAKTASDGETRDQWLQLASQWTYLALHSER